VKVDGDQRVAESLPRATGTELLPNTTFDRSDDDKSDARMDEIAQNFENPDLVHAFSGSRDSTGVTQDAVPTSVKFPLCDAAVRKLAHDEWGLADAVAAECSEPGPNGVRNESYVKIKAMREEIAQNHDIHLSFERVRKLRQVAAAFPPGRRRPAVSLESHLEAGTPEALDAFIDGAPSGTPLTRNYIRQLKHPAEKAKQDQQKAERWHQVKDQQAALLKLCRQLEREKEEREQRYADLCRSVGKEPEPFSPSLSPEDEAHLTNAEHLEQALRLLLIARGFNPTADNVKRAIDEFVRAVVVEQE
jgi:hypothetical protein